jgi:hypothetical protein
MENTFSLNADLRGKQITRLQVDNAFAMLCEDGSLITIESDFKLINDVEKKHIQISRVEDFAHALPILHSIITNIEIKESTLLLQFRLRNSQFLALDIQPSEEYEAWQIISKAHKKQYICMPSGDIAIFPTGNADV